MMERFDLVPLLDYIDPDESYQKWYQVGMALKKEGYSLKVWDTWSRRGKKYHDGECAKKWTSFNEQTETIVTGATITQWAKEGGWQPKRNDKPITGRMYFTKADLLVDPTTLDPDDFHEPKDDEWHPYEDMICYLSALFKPDEYVGLVLHSFQDKDGKWKPVEHGQNRRTAGTIIEALKQYKRADFAIGSLQNEAAGGWVRINPLDGEGAKNANVTDFRYALVESDNMPLGKQLALIRKMELPCAAIVYSGGKSVHAIVHVDADTLKEYQQRVTYLYDVCNKNGFKVDIQNKNPSRLSRIPGVTRNGKKQFLISTHTGKKDYLSWVQWIEEQTDDLPPFVQLGDIIEDLPPLKPALIEGVLRIGHKMMIAGPSKAGKSFLLMELAIAIAAGKTWLQFPCHQGKVLYINLEIDGISCEHRLRNIYEALDIPMYPSVGNITLWNLRGSAIPMDKLAPTIVRRCKDEHYAAVIIDPIYKVITGDENTASDMAYFGNQFDLICKELGCSVIYCHHHSKGVQGGKKAMDRSSGSGVFARDPDAILDMTPLEQKEEEKETEYETAYAIAGVLREFPGFKPFGVRFRYPVHVLDPTLDPTKVEGSMEGNRVKGNITQTQNKNGRFEEFVRTLEWHLENGDTVNQNNLAEEMQVSISTIRRYMKQANEPVQVYEVANGKGGKIKRVNELF